MAIMNALGPGTCQAGMSVDVEDWFHVENLNSVISRAMWGRYESRVERNTTRIVEMLGARGARATFFVLGWVAERFPELVRAIDAAGHEVASHGYGHELVYSLQPGEFRADILRSKHILEDLIGKPVRGYRAPCFSITDWAVPILQDAGFDYDSSVVPTVLHDRYGRLGGIHAGHTITSMREGFHEVSISCISLGRRGIPWGGGGYFRLVPYWLWRRGVQAILRSGTPYVFYLHPWEIDPGQPRVEGLDAISQFRHRVNLHRCEQRFSTLLDDFNWLPLGEIVDWWKTKCARTSAGASALGVNASVIDQS